MILTRSSHSQLHSWYIFRHHQHIKWASCDYQDTASLTGVVGVESDLSLWWCNGRVKHFKDMTFSIKGRGGVLIEYSSLTYSLKKIPATNIFSPGANEGKIWWSLHVDTLSQSQSAFWGKRVCWLLSFLRKSTKKCQIKCRVMHDYFFKCKLVAPLCLGMDPALLHFFSTPWDIWRKQRNYGLHLMVFPCHHSSVQLSNCRNWVTQLFDFSAIK